MASTIDQSTSHAAVTSEVSSNETEMVSDVALTPSHQQLENVKGKKRNSNDTTSITAEENVAAQPEDGTETKQEETPVKVAKLSEEDVVEPIDEVTKEPVENTPASDDASKDEETKEEA